MMTEELKKKYLSSKNKFSFLAKTIMKRKGINGKTWNFSEFMKIMNTLKKYQKDDVNLCNKVFEYLSSVDAIPREWSIIKIVLQATDMTTERHFKNESTTTKAIDLKQFL